MLRILLYALLFWFLYNLIFRFIVPLYKATRQVRQKFREMHQNMEEQVKNQPGSTGQPSPSSASGKPSGDYIDFEEVK